MDTDYLLKVLYYALGVILSLVSVDCCMDPPNLYQRFPSPIHRYFSQPKPKTIETVGGLPVSVNKNIARLLSRFGQRSLAKRQHTGCGPRSRTWQGGDVEDRALCNWHYIPRFNSSRYPNIVLEAETSCRECSSFFYDQTLPLGKCEPVYRNFPVLERTGCEDGIYKYDTTHVSVKVAFVCTRPRVAVAPAIVDNGVDISFLTKR